MAKHAAASDIRRRAEVLLNTNPEAAPNVRTADVQKLVHELHIFQIELEMQNEEMRHAQLELARSHDAYMELYDFSPVGYITLDQEGWIRKTNYAVAGILGLERGRLHDRCKFSTFVPPPSQDDWWRYLNKVFTGGKMQTCELNLFKKDGTPLIARLESTPLHSTPESPPLCMIALFDITSQKEAERDLKKHQDEMERLVNQRTIELRSKTDELEKDLGLAREVELALMPHSDVAYPAQGSPGGRRMQCSHRYLPSKALGGDFFDVLELSGQEIGVFICDVVGHGTRAALLTAVIRGLMEHLRSVGTRPGEFLTRLNQGFTTVRENLNDETFATAFYVVVDVDTGEIRYASAGHPSPFVLHRAGSRNVAPLPHTKPRNGPGLGLVENYTYQSCEGVLNPGDLLMLFTDGLVEAEGPNREPYGEQRLAEALLAGGDLPSVQLLDELVKGVRVFTGQPSFNDDVCLVQMEISLLDE